MRTGNVDNNKFGLFEASSFIGCSSIAYFFHHLKLRAVFAVFAHHHE
jgi:hypothetical protein